MNFTDYDVNLTYERLKNELVTINTMSDKELMLAVNKSGCLGGTFIDLIDTLSAEIKALKENQHHDLIEQKTKEFNVATYDFKFHELRRLYINYRLVGVVAEELVGFLEYIKIPKNEILVDLATSKMLFEKLVEQA